MINLSNFYILNNITVYNYWNNDFDLIRKGKFADEFLKQSKNENVQIKNKQKIIFDCCNEGISPNDILLATTSLKEKGYVFDLRVMFNVNVMEDLPYKYNCFPGHFVAHCGFVSHVKMLDINWKDLYMSKYFISLMRRASVSRASLAKNILDNFDSEDFLLSCGSQPNKWVRELPNLKKAIHPYKLPILLDGMIDNYKKQHHHTDSNFFACLFNVVVETSSQTDDDSWREVFITEKSLKPFAYRQFPVWFAVPGTVQEVRNLGFDVFDDIIDHSYDEINDPNTRMKKMINVLQTFISNNTLDDINTLRRKMWKRLNNNTKLLFKLNAEHPYKKHQYMLELSK